VAGDVVCGGLRCKSGWMDAVVIGIALGAAHLVGLASDT
jgi:hypothetical protein